MNSHIKNHPNMKDIDNVNELLKDVLITERETKAKDTVSTQFLKKYITYARLNVFPKLQDIDKERITQFYV